LNCPNCGKSWIAKIFWGYPADMESMEESFKRKEIVLGGCLVTDNDPKWECNDCGHQWGQRKDDEVDSDNTDSFDFHQGFNLDEVYD
jgi:hypothetical protein